MGDAIAAAPLRKHKFVQSGVSLRARINYSP
jgi:hypothetical protein